MNYDESALQRVREDRLLIDRCDAWLFEEIEPFLGQRILEVGCGLGNLARLLRDRELYIGIDSCGESVSVLQTQYVNDSNMKFLCMDVTDPSVDGLGNHRLDTVVSMNVFEHIDDDVIALRQVCRLLQPDGWLVLVVPAHDFLYGTMDRAIGHCRRYTKASMARKMAAAGLRVHEQKYLNALGALGWFVNGRILRQPVPPSNQLRAFNKIVPIVQKMERIVKSPIGISLLTIAKREGNADGCNG